MSQADIPEQLCVRVSPVFSISALCRNYENELSPNSYLFKVVTSLAHTMSSLCVERRKVYHGDPMAISVHKVPIFDFLNDYRTSPNSYVLGVVILAQAILALCMERIINGHGDHMATWVHIVSMVLFLSYKIHPRTVMCSEYVYLCHRTFRLCESRDF